MVQSYEECSMPYIHLPCGNENFDVDKRIYIIALKKRTDTM